MKQKFTFFSLKSLLLSALLSSSLLLFAQTNPSAQAIPYSQNFDTTTFTSLPTGTASWTVNSSPIGSQTNAHNSSDNGDATVTAATTTKTTGGTYGYCTSGNGRLYIQTSSNSTNGTNQLCLAISTIGYNNIKVSYDVEMISANERTFGLVLQYRIGTSGSWSNVTGGVYSHNSSDRSNGQVDNFVNLSLPQAAENNSVVQLRWACWRGTQTGNSSGGAIDNISVTASSSQVNGYFRSVQSGNWNSTSTWESSTDDVNWNAANVYPKYTANTITIQSGHTVTITATDTIDQVIINGTLVYGDYSGSTPVINNGTGADLTINGTFEDFGPNSITWETNATWGMGSDGSLIRSRSTSSNNWRDKYEGGISNIPSTANWIVRKTSSDSPTLSTTSNMYYPNLYIENNTGTEWETGGYCSFTGYLTNPIIKGNFYIGGNGTGYVSFLNENYNESPALVNGALVIDSGSTLRNFGTGFEIQGNLIVNGSIENGNAYSRSFVFSGGNSQSISGNGTINIYNLKINKSANHLTLHKSVNVSHQLLLSSKNIILDTCNLILGSSAYISGGCVSTHIQTNSTGKIIKKYSSAGSAFTFPTGDGTYYTPYVFTLTFGSFGTDPYISVRLVNSAETHVLSYSDYINRYWEVAANNISSILCDAGFTYSDSDIIGNENNFYAVKWNSTDSLKSIGIVNTATNKANASIIEDVGNFTIAGICNYSTDAGIDTNISKGDTVQIGSSPESGFTYSWYPSTGLSNASIANPVAFPSHTSLYHVFKYSEFGCVVSDTILVTVLGNAKNVYNEAILISPDPDVYIIGDTVHVPKWEKFEIGFKLPPSYENAVDSFFSHYYSPDTSIQVNPFFDLNPYADDSLRVVIDLISPSNRSIQKWGFFMRVADFNIAGDSSQPDDTNKLMLGNNPYDTLSKYNWRFRFAPDEVNDSIPWNFTISISAPFDTALAPFVYDSMSFICDPPISDNHGFLEVASNKRNLRFNDGTSFFGVGENIADTRHSSSMIDSWWFYDINADIFRYDDFTKRDFDNYITSFDEMNSVGANYIRKFFMKGDFMVEWDNLGVYDQYISRYCCEYHGKPWYTSKVPKSGNRQYNLWAFDKLIDKARNENIYIQLCVDPYPAIIAFQDAIWGNSAYAFYTYFPGTDSSNVIKYYSDTTLRYYWKRKYKYILSRWGYSVNIAALETFNEIDQTLGYYQTDTTENSLKGTGLCKDNFHNWDTISGLKDSIYEWHTDILGYVKDSLMSNANKHLTMVSYTRGGIHNERGNRQKYYNLFYNPLIDLADIHFGGDENSLYKEAFLTATTLIHDTMGVDKPFHFGELSSSGEIQIASSSNSFNVSTSGYFNNYDVSFHNELWASTFMGNFTTSLSWEWQTIHWWPDANPKELKYITTINDTIVEHIVQVDNVLGHSQPPPDLQMPNNQDTNFVNKKIFHSFKPLADFIDDVNINFGQTYHYKYFYDSYQNIECYYMVNSDTTKAYGWVHNLSNYWFNNYYYYYDNALGLDYERLNSCSNPMVAEVALTGFKCTHPPDDPLTYHITFYPTRMGTAGIPPDTVVESELGHIIDIGPCIANYINCDSSTADFAFKITPWSGGRYSNDSNRTETINNSAELDKTNALLENVNDQINESNPEQIDVIVFPNPSANIFYINVRNSNKNYNVYITDALGNAIYSKNSVSNKTSVDLASHPKGVYYLKVSIDNIDRYFKLIKK